MRVKRLGAGDWLSRRRRNGRYIAKALAKLMTPAAREKSRSVAVQFGADDALDVAARWLEELVRR